jgi:hypothetical protein
VVVLIELPHLLGNDFEGDDHVRKDDLANLFALFEMKAFRVYDPHLFQYRRFSRLASTYSVGKGANVEQDCLPNSSIFTFLACIFLSFRSSLSISAFFFLSSLVDR